MITILYYLPLDANHPEMGTVRSSAPCRITAERRKAKHVTRVLSRLSSTRRLDEW